MQTNKFKLKDKSTTSFPECIYEYLYAGFLDYILFKKILFIPIPDYTVTQSKWMLVFCVLITAAVGYTVRRNRCLTGKSIHADIFTGYGIYTIMAYRPYYRRWRLFLTAMFFLFVIGYAACVFMRNVKGKKLFQLRNQEYLLFILKSRILRVADASGLFLGLLMLALMFPIGYSRIVHGGIVAAVSPRSIKSLDADDELNEFTLAHNLDTIEKIRENARWMPLTSEEKLQVLQTICNCETNSFGLDCFVTVVIEDLPDTRWGDYDDSNRLIRIDRQHIERDNADQVLNTCLHEMYHAWEHCLVRLYLDSTETQRRMKVFAHCAEYVNELMDYKDNLEDEEGYMEYYCQYLEADSREYSEKAVLSYYKEIDILQDNYSLYHGAIRD